MVCQRCVVTGVVPVVDEAAGEHQPPGPVWHGGDEDESLHSPVQGESRTVTRCFRTFSRHVTIKMS